VLKIYYGVHQKPETDIVEYPMVSFRTMMKRKSSLIKSGKEWFLDSGAFTFLKQYGKFPFTYGEYLGCVSRFKPSLYANMDWCCEPSVRNRTKHTVDTHIALTVENGMQLIDFDKERFVMVIQGWEWEDYISCCEMIREQGLFTPVMGVGTICGRTDAKQVYDILKSIRASIPDWVKLHCFGVSLNLLRYKEIYDRIDSIDTFAWCRELGLSERKGDSKTRESALLSYIQKIESTVEKNEKQHLLEIDIN